MNLRTLIALGFMAAICIPSTVHADSVDARCDIYPAGEDHSSVVIPCTFSQYQGNIYIDRSDGIKHVLKATGVRPGNFIDEKGHAAYRQSGLGDRGVIFRFRNESIFLYWDASSLSVLKTKTAEKP